MTIECYNLKRKEYSNFLCDLNIIGQSFLLSLKEYLRCQHLELIRVQPSNDCVDIVYNFFQRDYPDKIFECPIEVFLGDKDNWKTYLNQIFTNEQKKEIEYLINLQQNCIKSKTEEITNHQQNLHRLRDQLERLKNESQ